MICIKQIGALFEVTQGDPNQISYVFKIQHTHQDLKNYAFMYVDDNLIKSIHIPTIYNDAKHQHTWKYTKNIVPSGIQQQLDKIEMSCDIISFSRNSWFQAYGNY